MHMSSLELDAYSGEKPIPFRSLFSREYGVIDVCNSSNWVIQKAIEIQHYKWLSCEGFEAQLMALLTAIEAGCRDKGRWRMFPYEA